MLTTGEADEVFTLVVRPSKNENIYRFVFFHKNKNETTCYLN